MSPLFLIAVTALSIDCSKTSTGLHPLTAPFFRTYNGFPTGLYPNTSDVRPPSHENGGQSEMAQVRPRNPAGSIDSTNGKIAVLLIGGGIALDADVNPKIVFGSASDAQVQAAWMLVSGTNRGVAFPANAQLLQAELKSTVQTLRARYPNLRLLYLSSSPYAGYDGGEPFAYQTGFAVKWLIEAQIQGDLDLSYTQGKAPWLSWGPYLWADGTNPRADGLQWSCTDNKDDKIAGMLLDFFKGDSTTRAWFVGPPSYPVPQPVLNNIVNAASYASAIGLAAIASIFGTELADANALAPRVPLPYGLSGTSVTIGGAPAPLYAVSPTQINLIVPPEASGTDVVVTRDSLPSAPITIQYSFFTEGFFSLDATGTGPASARHVNGDLITSQNPARRGETVALYATGKGVLNPQILIPTVLPVVRVGGVQAEIGYFSIAPGIPGLDQVNITIPVTAPIGDRVPVVMQNGTSLSNQVTLAIAP
jgi:uncharacterized protein (TIGR03437 family)